MKSLLKKLTPALLVIVMASCVPHRQYTDVLQKQETCEAENVRMKSQLESLQTDVNEFNSKYDLATRKLDALRSDTAVMGSSLRILRNQYDKINALNNELLSKTNALKSGSEQENAVLMGELNQARIELQAKEDALNALDAALKTREVELKDREETLAELRTLLSRKDSSMNALRQKVSNALVGFEGKGLTVEKRNGRVYVSMEAKLLFATGSTEVDKEGKKAIIDLARAIQSNDDLNIMVEGHTDTDAFSKSDYPRNNWDLSVLRATSVIKIMLDNSEVDPRILTAAGRSEFQPVDPANKARNRRIEVILSPKLDELMEIINTENQE